MNAVAIASIALGILYIVTRGPLIFAPEETVRVFLRFLENSAGIRAMGCLLGLAGFATLRGTAGAVTTLSVVIRFIAWLMVGGGVLLLLFPDAYGQLARSVLMVFDAMALRILGALGVGIGGLFVYFGAKAT